MMTKTNRLPHDVMKRPRAFLLGGLLVAMLAAGASIRPADAASGAAPLPEAEASAAVLPHFEQSDPMPLHASGFHPAPADGRASASPELVQSIAVAHVAVPPRPTPPPTPAKAAPRARIVWMEVTAYCACRKCCGRNARGITASGKPVSFNGGRFVAADTRLLPFGTNLSIPGYNGGKPVPVIDRGGAIKGRKLDVYFSSHAVARQWGRQRLPVTVFE